MINFIWKHLTGSLLPLVCHRICTIVMLGRKNFTNLIFNEILVLISVEILYIVGYYVYGYEIFYKITQSNCLNIKVSPNRSYLLIHACYILHITLVHIVDPYFV